jgi:hypothetical protein
MVLALGFLLFLVASCYTSPLDEARKQVPAGTLRDDAIRVLTEKAWYHQPCPNLVGGELETITDLFFFGSHKYDKADIVIVTSKPVNGIFVVDGDLGSFEPYLWQAVYQDCIQRERFED